MPDALALVSRHQGVRLTWRELDQLADELARGLLASGIQKGDRIGIWSPTCVEWTLLQMASGRVGSILVNVNPAYRTAELSYALSHSGVRMLVTAPRFKSSDYLAMLSDVRPTLPALECVVVIGEAPSGAADQSFEELMVGGADVDLQMVRAAESLLDPDDPINIQYTSGTTGNPKGATLTHHNILNNARSIADVLEYTDADRVCIPVPLYHCFGMGIGTLGCVTSGAAMVYPAESFEPEATLDAIAEESCTSIYGVPTMFIAMLASPGFGARDLRSLRTGIMAGAPCPVEVMKRVVNEMHASEMSIAYGMTETSPASTMTRRWDDLERRTSTVGTALPHVEVKIADPVTGGTVPTGAPGELCSRGYLVMDGYWRNPDATAEAIDSSGWMHTGDLAVMDRDGYVNIVGRSKDMVIRGGENIYPREIEEVLFQHPGVTAAQVIGVPDERMGEELMAWVTVAEGQTLTEEQLCGFCRDRLARFKVPRYWKFVSDFPLTVTGKVQKFKMRETAVAELGLEAAAQIETA
ncbi:MAG TPA: AMP-binding protein [Acidimicrobiales bacterium]|nr:AMP-binding protein [Acidimicrobiales bacterium]